jgi:MFS family permease
VVEPALSPGSWRLVAALGVTQIVSWGSMYYAFSLMIGAFAAAAHADRSVVVGAFSVALVFAGLASAPIGRLIDRHGGRWVMTTGSLAGGLLLAALAGVGNAWQLYALWALLGVAMAATLYDPAFAVLVQVFHERQRQAITALTLFGGFASTVFWPLTQALMQHLGWQQALLALGALNLLVCAPLHAWILPGTSGMRGKAPGTPSQRISTHDWTFVGLCIAFTGNALVFSAMSVHLISLLQGKGLSAAHAAWVGALIGPMQVTGRVLEYTLLSRWSPSRVGSLAMWMLPASLGLLALVVPQLGVMAAFALLYGMGNGVMTIVRGATPVELYGRERYGAINGAMATPVLVAKAAGPIFASLVLTATGSLLQVLLFLAAIGAISAVVFSLTVRRRRATSVPGYAAR